MKKNQKQKGIFSDIGSLYAVHFAYTQEKMLPAPKNIQKTQEKNWILVQKHSTEILKRRNENFLLNIVCVKEKVWMHISEKVKWWVRLYHLTGDESHHLTGEDGK